MTARYTTLISADALRQLPDAFIVDCSHDLSNPQAGRDAYAAGHIPGAIFLHLDEDLSASPTGRNGRHPLPDADAFARRLADLGLRQEQQVVAYDRSGGAFAARLWWMLRWLGHDAVAVLDGGWQAWMAAGGARDTSAPPQRARGNFQRRPALVGTVSAHGVLDNLQSGKHLVVDARAPERYSGEIEDRDPVAGHIPGAKNRFFQTNLLPDGTFKSAQQLRTEYTALLEDWDPRDVIHHCGSGVTGCHNLLALAHAGLDGGLLYPGSWSEWCADPSRPVATGAVPGKA
ncbi:sulfurtransferase [Thiomonas sp.]|uniref:sulfurtransferase n=1 Tax=Thiomonas sp. TaxID=2047785 RepID=UPI00260CC319|nr:sulfurtransferase [Thiomonas sp.]